jgi:lipopolysaccharide/colanic/teichoic acid biosynthesis glycosyltransferase
MDDLIMYEKSRSDRRGTTLSLVLFDTSLLRKRGAKKFVEEVLTIVRTTDHVGWFGRSSVAVLLPETSPTGAQVFLNHATEFGRPSWIPAELYSYPDMWLETMHGSNGNGTDEAGSNGEGESHTEGSNGNGSSQERLRDFSRVTFVKETPRWKRALDVFGAGLGVLVLTPIFLLISIYIKTVSPGPVLFKQKRVGIGRREFTFLKFRTMHVGSEVSDHAEHTKDLIGGDQSMQKLDDTDPRIIFGGRVLRKASIDELPQLFNVLRGDMSLVGPRPCIPYEAEEYLRWHTGRFSILPGLTGLWQVSGKNKLTFKQMIRLDIAYEKRRSLLLDMWIILMTVPTIFGLVLESVGNRVEHYAPVEATFHRLKKAKETTPEGQGCPDHEQHHRSLAHAADRASS